jgi:hypothetical protein
MLRQLGDKFIGELDLIPIHRSQQVGWHFITNECPDFIPQRFLFSGQQGVIEHGRLLSLSECIIVFYPLTPPSPRLRRKRERVRGLNLIV